MAGRNKKTTVVNKKHSQYDVDIGRPSIWGNPYKIGRDGTREEVIEKYRQYLYRSPKLLVNLGDLRGKRLGCYCSPEACHGDVLVEMIRDVFGQEW